MENIEENNLVIVSTATLLLVIFIMLFLYLIFLKKKTTLMLEQKEKDIWFEKELANTQVEIKEQTLNYIGQELHDDLGQKLSVVRLKHNQLLNKIEDAHHTELIELNELLGECIQDIRNLSKNLITEQIVHFGLIESIEHQVLRIEKLRLLHIDFSFNNHDVDIPAKHSLILFRIIQESLNNILKHSKAKEVKITITEDPNTLNIEINDNGKGFQIDHAQDGSGLKNMELRAKLLGASFKVISIPNTGTTTKIVYKKNISWNTYQ
ncbi:sensor histidine kinase [Sphingobacterium sp. SGL-16]|uniref:sensor histidine kinase n=1 Tax=Sphingobacterium sp. SGL-16 TaxID=2710883 RepID=UPI0013E9AAD6|nr:sensor histidine kinase [Sphingobacterium sp. SGL-16]NGM74445.1 sensor histidine kinase [Sphingobacterium sp. SGL-16]